MVSIFSFYMYNLSVFQKNMKCYSFMPVTVLHCTPTAVWRHIKRGTISSKQKLPLFIDVFGAVDIGSQKWWGVGVEW